MSGYRHVVDGTIQVPLPDDKKARAEAMAEVGRAWSTMLSSLDHLMVQSREPSRLVGRALKMSPAEQSEYQRFNPYGQYGTAAANPPAGTEKPPVAANSVPPAAKPNGGDHRTPEHMAKMREASIKAAKKRRREAKRAGKGK